MTPILFITYRFPPQGGAGVQRSLKFAKYLPELGFDPIVVAAKPNNVDAWAPKDASLSEDLSATAKTFYLSWVPSRFGSSSQTSEELQLVQAIVEIAESFHIEAVLVSMSPFDDSVLAESVARRLGVPWIADLRDPWALDEFQTYRTGIHRLLERRKMRLALRTAAGIIMNTPEAAHRLTEAFPEYQDVPVRSISNGYDAEDFACLRSSRNSDLPTGKFNIVHTGTFHTVRGLRQRQLTLLDLLLYRSWRGVRLLPRSPYYLFQSIRHLKNSGERIIDDLNIVFVGNSHSADQHLAKAFGLVEFVTSTGYVSHKNSVGYLADADLLFLPMHRTPKDLSASIVPGKTYEYLASGSRVLAAVPDGDAKSIVQRAGNADLCSPDDWKRMATLIYENHERWSDRRGQKNTEQRDFRYLERFERRNLAQELASFLSAILRQYQR